MAALLAIEAVSHRYGAKDGDRFALNNLSLSIQPNEQFGLIGPNGSGKSTLMRLLSTVMKVQSGRLLFSDQDYSLSSEKVRENMGVVFQTSTLDKKLSVRENLMLMARIQGVSRQELRARTEKLIYELELTENASTRAANLSGGNRRRVELAMALLHRPKLLLLDEPTTGLDPIARRDFWSLIFKLRRELGVTVVVATHFLDEAEYCDRLALLHRGNLIAQGTPQSLTARFTSDRVTISTKFPEEVASAVSTMTGAKTVIQGGELFFEAEMARNWVAKLMEALGQKIDSIAVKRAGLESFYLDAVEGR